MFGSAPAYREKDLGIWQVWTWSQAASEIEALALGFLTLGRQPGDILAILGCNRALRFSGPSWRRSDALGTEIFDFYCTLGRDLTHLCGQTEASVFITRQRDGEVRSDTAGTPTPGVERRMDADREVFFRAPGFFQRYFRNDDSTAATEDADGWVAAGDAGFIGERHRPSAHHRPRQGGGRQAFCAGIL